MKKFFTLVAMALMAVGANAQELIASADFTTATEFTGWTQFADEQTDGSVTLQQGEGLAITVGIQTGQLWQPQIMVIPDGSFNLEEDGNYKVVVTAKYPTDGKLQINMGTWGTNDQAAFDVTSSGDVQTDEFLFEGWSATLEGCHLLFQCGDFKGTTLLQKIEVYNMDAVAETVIAESNFDGGFEGDYPYWYQFADEQTDGSVASDPEGVAITVGTQTGQLWQPQVMVIPDGSFNLEEDGNYKVVVTAKYPTDGKLQINMGTWGTNDQAAFDVTSSGDVQTDEFLFEGWSATLEGCHLLFQCGDFKGTTILKSIKVIQIGGEDTGIQTATIEKAGNGAIYNLAGQKVSANYKGVVIQNGRKFIQK